MYSTKRKTEWLLFSAIKKTVPMYLGSEAFTRYVSLHWTTHYIVQDSWSRKWGVTSQPIPQHSWETQEAPATDWFSAEASQATVKPAITVGILVSLLGFSASKVELVNKFKLMEDMFWLSIWQYQIQPLPLCQGLDLLSSRYMWDCCHA